MQQQHFRVSQLLGTDVLIGDPLGILDITAEVNLFVINQSLTLYIGSDSKR